MATRWVWYKSASLVPNPFNKIDLDLGVKLQVHFWKVHIHESHEPEFGSEP